MPHIQVIEYEQAEGQLREIYDQLIKSRGKLAGVHKIQSLNPPTIVAHMELYMKIMFGKSPLRRYQREMLGVVVSRTNRCRYCIEHHAEALQFFWKEAGKVAAFKEDFRQVELSEPDHLLCKLAENLTRAVDFPGKQTLFDQIRELGLGDRAILDATLVIAYFNFVNRIVEGLGVEIESEGAGGYSYD